MTRSRPVLNFLVISIIVFMIALTAVFIFSSVYLKGKIAFQFVQKTELISELITRSVFDLMSAGHGQEKYSMVRAYGNIVGVDDIGIYRLDGSSAFHEAGLPDGGPAGYTDQRIAKNEEEHFRKAAAAMNTTGFFNWEEMAYSQYVPLRAEGSCSYCHAGKNETIGVLRIRLSTGSDFELLGYFQKLIWILGLIVFLPAGALLVAGAIIREKNRIHSQLEQSNESLHNIFNKLNETRYYLQMILDNSRVLIVTTDNEGRIVEFNKEAEKLLEYAKEEVVGKSVLMLYDNPGQRSEFISKAVSEGGRVWAVRDREAALRSKTGKIFTVSLTLSTMADENEKILGTVGVGRDMSEQKMLHFKLLQAEKLAGIGTLASGIAHEINNPLAGILGMAEAIKEEGDMGLIKSYTDDIIRYAVAASNIVKELSAYSRSAHNDDHCPIDVAAVMENSIKMARHSASFTSIELVTDLEGGCRCTANQGEIQQVFINLIINAVHAIEDGGTMTLRCVKQGGVVVASVADNGCGIPQEHLSKIYDPFFTTKPVGKGTGLGLYVVYRIVTKHRGSIDVESRVGGGTTFTLRFPLNDAYTDQVFLH
ncbi:MAG: PAS domain S-box protein [Deltaproteobacteria bacterium]|nr:PAS domain S-box protein [Deltaproteobacteria bacterium]